MAKKLAAEKLRNYASMALSFGLFILLVAGVTSGVRTGSPMAMLQSQVVRGEKIYVPTATVVSNADTSALAVLSNSIADTAPANALPLLRRLTAADSNSFPEVIERDGKNYLNLTFAKLAGFPFTVTPEMADATKNPEAASRLTRGQVPEAVKSLGEKPAAITGFMLPVGLKDGLASDFLLLRNQSACCYGIMPRVNEWVIVHANGKGVKPVMDVPVTALGTFHVGEMRDNGRLIGIYLLECTQLLPTKLSL
jgi:hypothetical protein